MKNLKLFLILCLGIIFIVSSCEKEDEMEKLNTSVNPSISNHEIVNTKIDGLDLEELIDTVAWFETEIIEEPESEGNIASVEDMLFYLQNYLNMRYAYPELESNTFNTLLDTFVIELNEGGIVDYYEIRSFNDVILSFTDNQFNAVSGNTKQFQSGYFEILDEGEDEAIILYISVIAYEDGETYYASETPFESGDDWYWGWELGPYGQIDWSHTSPDATTRIEQQAWAYIAPSLGGIPMFWAEIEKTQTVYNYWSTSPYDNSSQNQPWLDNEKMNYWYAEFVDDIESYISQLPTGHALVHADYTYFGIGNGGFGSIAEHGHWFETAVPYELPEDVYTEKYPCFLAD